MPLGFWPEGLFSCLHVRQPIREQIADHSQLMRVAGFFAAQIGSVIHDTGRLQGQRPSLQVVRPHPPTKRLGGKHENNQNQGLLWYLSGDSRQR